MVPQLLLHKSLIFQPGTGSELGYDISSELSYAVANMCKLERSELDIVRRRYGVCVEDKQVGGYSSKRALYEFCFC